jgi:peptide deformylase
VAGDLLAAFAYNVDGQLGYVINPRVVSLSDVVDGPEGCLSIPGIYAECRRRRPRGRRVMRQVGQGWPSIM